MLHIIWPNFLTGGDLPDVGYTFCLIYLWRWIVKVVAGYSLYFPVLQTQRHNADQGNFSSPKFQGTFLLFVRNSQSLLVLIQFKVPFGVGTPSGISGDCQWGYGCCGKKGQLFPGVPVCGAHIKFIHAGHSLARGNPKFWRQLSELVSSPPPFQAEEQQRVYGVWGWFQAGGMGLTGR